MRTIPLGRTGQTVGAIGLGCMGMSEFYGATDDGESLRTLAAAYDAGITHWDSADTYGLGHNESLIGRFLAGSDARPVVATKFGIVREAGRYERRIDNSPAYVQAACEASLRRLGVEAIDLYYCHRRDPAVPIEELIGAMARLVEQGKVRWLGLSEVAPDTLRRAHTVHPITAIQSEYSLWSRDVESSLLPVCRELGVSFVAYSPLGRAFLTGAISSPDSLPEGDFRRNLDRFQGDAFARNKALTDRLTELAAAKQVTSAQLALAWLLAQPGGILPIPGTKRVARIAENAAAADITLSADEVAALSALFSPDAVAGARYPEAGWVGIERG